MEMHPLPKRGRSPHFQFSAHFYCSQAASYIKMPLGMEEGLSPGDFLLDGDPAPSPKWGRNPQFSAHVYCVQTAAWIKMLRSTEVGLGLRDIVLYGDPATLRKEAHHPHPSFSPFLLWPNGWMDQGATWYGGKPRSRRCCVKWGRSSP